MINFEQIYSFSDEPYIRNELLFEYLKTYIPMRHVINQRDALDFLFDKVMKNIWKKEHMIVCTKDKNIHTLTIKNIPNMERVKNNCIPDESKHIEYFKKEDIILNTKQQLE